MWEVKFCEEAIRDLKKLDTCLNSAVFELLA